MKKSIAIFGGGPSSLALASFLDTSLFDVTIYEKNKTCGRKFLVAGKGGFNLTHSESIELLKARFIPNTFLASALDYFTNDDLIKWLANMGIETFVGSSNRVFPIKEIKPIHVLDTILEKVKSNHVEIQYQSQWTGWSEGGLPLVNGDRVIKSDYYVYAFGGASWSVTGSTGSWANEFKTKEITINEFEASNCAFKVDWPKTSLDKIEGKPLKNISVSCGEETQKGELVITRFGLEGNGIYALSHQIREALKIDQKAIVTIDFKPMFSFEDIKEKRFNSKSKNSTSFLRDELKLSKVAIHLIKQMTSKEAFLDEERLVKSIKGLEISVLDLAPIEEAISTVGGIDRSELTSNFEMKKMEHSFCIGEMIDWDAPTGGYLLQACLSMGVFLAAHLNNKSLEK